jgi:NADH-quinone oxidoreductase subunit C
MTRLETLRSRLQTVLGDAITLLSDRLGETTIVVPASRYVEVAHTLRDHPDLRFETLIDLAGIDYSAWREGLDEDGSRAWLGGQGRFAAVSHLLSLEHNWRLRVRSFCPADDFPLLPSLIEVWPAVGWFEREAFDLYGIVFEGHPDLRRILTDYGFIGHPFRKDFPVSGHVEMRYDPEQRRVVYQPVTIEPREITPRIIREDGYAQGR